jgi:RNA polymerase sigma-70 factor, ECF subfamily
MAGLPARFVARQSARAVRIEGRLSRVTEGPKQAGALADVSDAALVERLTHGDREALAALYGRHAACLLALAVRMLQDKQESEDLLHDVFLEAWQHSAEYSEARSTVRGWLLLRMRSRALDRLRTRARRRGATADEQLPGSSTAPETTLTAQRALPSALAKIPVPQQAVIVLSYFEGLNTVEISSRLGIPAGTVKSRAHAAMAALRQSLGVADD